MNASSAMFWLTVLALPSRPAGMISRSLTATSRSPVTANSRVIMIIAAQAPIDPS